MVSNIFGGKSRFDDEMERQEQRQATIKRTNRACVIVPEGHNVTGSCQLQAYGLDSTHVDIGFEISYYMQNNSGGGRLVNWTITNNTQGTTLKSGSKTLCNGGVDSATFFFTLEKITEGDMIHFTISNDGVGTAAGALAFGYFGVDVTSVFLAVDEEIST